MHFVELGDIGTGFETCFQIEIHASKVMIWRMAFVALIWSIWNSHNQPFVITSLSIEIVALICFVSIVSGG